jgi:hypothetical protein
VRGEIRQCQTAVLGRREKVERTLVGCQDGQRTDQTRSAWEQLLPLRVQQAQCTMRLAEL